MLWQILFGCRRLSSAVPAAHFLHFCRPTRFKCPVFCHLLPKFDLLSGSHCLNAQIPRFERLLGPKSLSFRLASDLCPFFFLLVFQLMIFWADLPALIMWCSFFDWLLSTKNLTCQRSQVSRALLPFFSSSSSAEGFFFQLRSFR